MTALDLMRSNRLSGSAKTCGTSARSHSFSPERVFILTSFSNPKFLDDMAKLLRRQQKEVKTRIILSFGEPDRSGRLQISKILSNISPHWPKTNDSVWKEECLRNRRWEKLVVSDAGYAFISSCNLFSGSLESGILESGLLIKDGQCLNRCLRFPRARNGCRRIW